MSPDAGTEGWSLPKLWSAGRSPTPPPISNRAPGSVRALSGEWQSYLDGSLRDRLSTEEDLSGQDG